MALEVGCPTEVRTDLTLAVATKNSVGKNTEVQPVIVNLDKYIACLSFR